MLREGPGAARSFPDPRREREWLQPFRPGRHCLEHTAFVFQLGRSDRSHRFVPEETPYARTKIASLSQALRRWWVVGREFAVTEGSSCKSHCK